MGMSAFWHGIHPGYYFSFLSVVPCLIAEDLLIASLRDNRPLLQQQIFDWCCWFHKLRQFDYMSMGFLLLTMDKTFRYWRSIYYFCHVLGGTLDCAGTCAEAGRAPCKICRREDGQCRAGKESTLMLKTEIIVNSKHNEFTS